MTRGLSRRGMLGRGLAGGAAVLTPGLVRAQAHALGRSTPSLAALARAKGLQFGSAVGAGKAGTRAGGFDDPGNRQVLIDECGLLVPENELKWYVLRPDDKTFAFERADRIAAFARDHGLALRGHTLLWNHPDWTPAWLKAYDFGAGPAAAAKAQAMLVDHIAAVCARYPQIASWDVVNETVDPKDGQIRRTVFTEAMGGDQTLDVAYHAARAAAPGAKLVYNDYMGWDLGEEAHRTGVLKLLEGFRKRGTPVDTLGVQSHLGGAKTSGPDDFARPDEKAWRAFLDEVTGMGYGLAITEFDINDKALTTGPTQRDAAVAAHARAYLDLMLDYRQVREVLTWGMVDKYSWLQTLTPRADGGSKRPLPYDDDYRPKPLRAAMAAALSTAPKRG